MPWPTSPTIGDVYQPEPPDGVSYIYRGGGRWDVLIQPSAASLAGYYTRSQIDALLENASSELEAAIAGLEEEYVPLSQRGAAEGVATLTSVNTGCAASVRDVTGYKKTDGSEGEGRCIGERRLPAFVTPRLRSTRHGHERPSIRGTSCAETRRAAARRHRH